MAGKVYFGAGELSDTEPKVVWMHFTNPIKLRYTSLADFKSAGSQWAMPIAYVYKNGVAQVVRENIYPQTRMSPFWCWVSKETYQSEDSHGNPTTETGWFIRVNFGTVNNVIPTLGGFSLTDTEKAREMLPSDKDTQYIYLRCDREAPPTTFPVKVVIDNYDEEQTSDSDSCYILLAIVQKVNGAYTVSNNLTGSLNAEAHKFTADSVRYFWYRI